MHGLKKLLPLCLIIAGIGMWPSLVRAQSSALIEEASPSNAPIEPDVCRESMPIDAAKTAFRQVCLRAQLGNRSTSARNAIIIGFVGGFVQHDDFRHPEVQFAQYLRQHYPANVHADVFANHDGRHALLRVLQLLDTDKNGVLSSSEKKQANIIIYGHSWGASQAVTLAEDLGRLDVPVSLTILLDSVHKPGHKDAVIPPSVQSAVNFYQTKGIIHGRSHIRVADPERTNLIGNIEMTYQGHPINCDNYPWLARHLNKPHHEIENDPRVWEQTASLIDSTLSNDTPALEASITSSSPGAK
jgi:hypothetical protein